ncbi:MAG: nucleotidyltransferase family protein [Patescibacteria group bacterium]
MDIQTIRLKITPLLKHYHVRKASLFGSAARGEVQPDSDLDILVEMPSTSGLFDFLALQSDLEELFARSVDLVEFDAIRERLKPYILHDQTPIFAV